MLPCSWWLAWSVRRTGAEPRAGGCRSRAAGAWAAVGILAHATAPGPLPARMRLKVERAELVHGRREGPAGVVPAGQLWASCRFGRQGVGSSCGPHVSPGRAEKPADAVRGTVARRRERVHVSPAINVPSLPEQGADRLVTSPRQQAGPTTPAPPAARSK